MFLHLQFNLPPSPPASGSFLKSEDRSLFPGLEVGTCWQKVLGACLRVPHADASLRNSPPACCFEQAGACPVRANELRGISFAVPSWPRICGEGTSHSQDRLCCYRAFVWPACFSPEMSFDFIWKVLLPCRGRLVFCSPSPVNWVLCSTSPPPTPYGTEMQGVCSCESMCM